MLCTQSEMSTANSHIFNTLDIVSFENEIYLFSVRFSQTKDFPIVHSFYKKFKQNKYIKFLPEDSEIMNDFFYFMNSGSAFALDVLNFNCIMYPSIEF